MILEINKLISSEHEFVRKIGWLLYKRENQDEGLTQEEVYSLMGMMDCFEDEIQKSYNDGFHDALNY